MGKTPLVLSFDCGTQSARALLYDNAGNLVDYAAEEYAPYFSRASGWAEQHADFYFEKLCDAARTVLAKDQSYKTRLVGVTLTTFRDTAVCLDQENRPIAPCILWMDTRRAENLPRFSLYHELLYTIAGMRATAYASRAETKSNWIRQETPEIWEKTEKYVLLSGYLTYRFTNNLVDSMASQVGHIPFWYPKKKWMRKSHLKYPIFDIPAEKMIDLLEPGEKAGEITSQVAAKTDIPAGLPFLLGGADKSCETLGSGCIDNNTAALSLGTSSTVQVTTEKYVEPQVFMPAYPAVTPGHYNPEIQVYHGYWMVSWYKEQFGEEARIKAAENDCTPESLLDLYLEETPPGAENLFLQPYWGNVLKKPQAKGAIIGFHGGHTKKHIYRAILEGINYELMDGLKKIARRTKYEIQRLTISGGGARSEIVCQLAADMFGLPVYRVQTSETAGLGAAMVAYLGLGEFASMEQTVAAMVRHMHEYLPDKGLAAFYEKQYKTVYKKMYGKLHALYKEMQ